MLRVEGLHVTFGGVKALNGVDLSVDLHSITAVVGPNGAGKTTLLNAVNGFLRDRVSGRITINGQDTVRMRPAELSELGVARSFQEPRLIEATTVLDNVLCGAHVTRRHGVISQLLLPRLAAREEAASVERARAILDVMGMDTLADTPLSQLSYGHRKLVDLARAVMRQPDLLLLDEPSSGLDEREQAALADTLRQLHERERTTIVLIEHHMTLVRAVADWMVAMQTGRAVVAGPPEAVLESREFKDALVGDTRGDDDEDTDHEEGL
ncbi:ATP-binding cassette domain-containing protein [Amycolatopsis sp. NPDC005232]|uniref:ABC transporter ATP-binding protein n=1 Tax=Amycolatopsis sp. NPDC005232 TaxID=3157027 RepID=UPI0033A5F223